MLCGHEDAIEHCFPGRVPSPGFGGDWGGVRRSLGVSDGGNGAIAQRKTPCSPHGLLVSLHWRLDTWLEASLHHFIPEPLVQRRCERPLFVSGTMLENEAA